MRIATLEWINCYFLENRIVRERWELSELLVALGLVCVCVCVCAQLYPTLCDPMGYVACQTPLSMWFSRQEYWSGLPLPSPGDLPNPGMEPTSPVLAGRFFNTEPPQKPSFTKLTTSNTSQQRQDLLKGVWGVEADKHPGSPHAQSEVEHNYQDVHADTEMLGIN